MEKPTIFVSHAAVDSEIAGVFKADVEKNFLGMCKLFVSSDLDSLRGGVEWIKNIKTNLEQAVISIGLYSPHALSRPWIYTEFGAGWIRGIPTISVCHSGLRRDNLPVPLSHFQALDLIDEFHLRHLYEQISEAVRCQLPQIDYASEVQRYREITENQRVKRIINEWMAQLKEWNPELNGIFAGQDNIEVLVPSQAEQAFFEFKRDIESNQYLVIENNGFGMGTRVGAQASIWRFHKGERFQEFVQLMQEQS